MTYTTDASRWRALTVRDINANGQFVYSIKSTKIYCRPNCPGRLARRANVDFYKTAKEAQEAGFRACKRCRPDVEAEEPQYRTVAKACSLIEEASKNHDRKAFRLQDLAKQVGLTPRYFHKVFKDRMGMTPKEYAQIKMTDGSGSIATSVPIASQPDVEFFDWEAFDSENAVDIGVESSTTSYNGFTAEDIQSAATFFGNGNNTCFQFPAWDWGQPGGTDSEFGLVNESMDSLLGATPALVGME
ncbi:hypothetical protein P153DRAFT_175882 [Dothidotthia symphoricarpi CBS 119687]|uniref:HTH araC/xylS-type domain-containing protein n=1 Tax=Dothidotthia symphoricarpi CBS 119687 TaxID=1392245 RepID=A0A6A6AQV4_9PLEO|nr:uncharacterized protein P153DRAFT_175882 [Dothidotthia symphoricarpi CBS 119687]KAF2132891.1 hypothetical protein P153DRAFT_175882 [Dothidotthia symphoricarpi CBS 119687]